MRARLEEQVRQHNKKRAEAVSVTDGTGEKKNIDEDSMYEVTLDDDFLLLWNMECLRLQEWDLESTGW
ncbi:hypothetical protein V6Z11_1Z021000 [Gossypium hirsutum]